jgi:CheY-like chemotaxis protein
MSRKRNNLRGKSKKRASKRNLHELLRESEERFRIMADCAPMAIWIKGPNDVGGFANKAAIDAFGRMISDIGMPDEDGYTLMQKVRAMPAVGGGAIPAIALTAYGNIEHRMRALEAGFQTYAVKPVEPNELVAAIQGLLKGFDQKVA